MPRLPRPSLAWFYNECLRPAAPAVLTGVIDGWPARSTRPWSDLAYLKRVAGHRTVPVEVGAHYLDDAFDERLMTIADFLEAHVEGGGAAGGGGAASGGGRFRHVCTIEDAGCFLSAAWEGNAWEAGGARTPERRALTRAPDHGRRQGSTARA